MCDMGKRYKKYTQKDFAGLFNKIDQSIVSKTLRGLLPVSWPWAEELAVLFPSKDVIGWKYAKKEDLNNLYNKLKHESELKGE